MDPVTFAFATFSMVDLCVNRSGRSLYSRCQSYRHAEAELANTILEIEGYWLKIQDQVIVLREIWDSLDERFQIHQNNVLRVLQGNLQSAISTLDNIFGTPENIDKWEKIIAKKGEIRRLKYMAHAKESLDRIVDQLGRWFCQFDLSWILLSRSSLPSVRRELAKREEGGNSAISSALKLREAHDANDKPSKSHLPTSIFFNDEYEIKDMKAIALSPVSSGLTIDGRFAVIDHYFVRDEDDLNIAKKEIRDLAIILSKVDRTFTSLLQCEGVVRVETPPTGQAHFDMVFRTPSDIAPASACSLRYLFLHQDKTYPLNERIRLAMSLARSVVFLHASKIVHKNIAPENIIMLDSGPDALGTPFLVGFQRFRFDERKTNMTGDSRWEKNLYRHPQRQGLHPEEVYTMRHDIYSVGVCLLEIGMWRSFVHYSGDWTVTGADSELPIASQLSARNKRKATAEIKTILVELAQTRLPQLMGRIYTDIVISCLTCLDRDGPLSKDASEFEDPDGIIVGVRYIEKILFDMEKICV